MKIEDYAFLSDTQTGALVGRAGSVDWLCFPRFDSGACFAALLGDPEKMAVGCSFPEEEITATRRRYRDGTLILETEIETAGGAIRLIDFMPPRKGPDIVRIVEAAWQRRAEDGVDHPVRLRPGRSLGAQTQWRPGSDRRTRRPVPRHARRDARRRPHDRRRFHRGERRSRAVRADLVCFSRGAPRAINPEHALEETSAYWKQWSEKCQPHGEWHEAVVRSLITLKGLTYAPTGGIVAAATTSLPEEIGGVRNWDYRYCWLRDATYTLYALMNAGYLDESRAWREWLLRAIAGSAAQMQIMYGVQGERRLNEDEIPWLAGYENSKPVRIGNAASNQFQLDVYGEVLAAMYGAHRAGIENSETEWQLQIELMKFLETKWRDPDEGIWEVRGGPQQFTHSKMMAWLAFDRAVKLVEHCDCAAVEHHERWKKIRDEIHAQVCEQGYNAKKKAFTQVYGGDELDASLLMMPLVGFLPIDDERVVSTIEAIERELMRDGFVLRYRTERKVDGLPGSEGVFLPCSFWLADCLHLMGRTDEARELFERLLKLRNDLGLLSEEYDPRAKRQLGNFPQAFTHVALVNTANLLSGQARRKHLTGRKE